MKDISSVTRSNCETPDLISGLDTNDAPQADVSVGLLNDDVLLVIFEYCRLADEDEDEVVVDAFSLVFNEGNWNWNRQRWWYNLTQVCQRWRYLTLASPSRLDLICTEGIPVEEKLAHFLQVPLIVRYGSHESREMPPDDERNILLCLERPNLVRRILLSAATSALQKMVVPLDYEFPLLDSLAITSVSDDDDTEVMLPRSLRAPNLRHLVLMDVALQPGTPILTNPIHLVTLVLEGIDTLADIPPEYLVDLLECMPQLKILSVGYPPFPDHDEDTRPLAPVAQKTFITLHRLEQLHFMGDSSYLEGLLARINAPVLELFYVGFPIFPFSQSSLDTLSNLSRFLEATAELGFRAAQMNFQYYTGTIEMVSFRPPRNPFLFSLRASGRLPDWRIDLASQFCSAMVPVFSATEELTFRWNSFGRLLSTQSNDRRLQWHNILRPFNSVKTLKLEDGFQEELFLHLQSDGEGPLLELLPSLQQIVIPAWNHVENVLRAFIDSRRIAGHPVNLVRTGGL